MVLNRTFPLNSFHLLTSFQDKECLSVVFGTETTAKYAQSMTQIVTRAGGEIPAVLKSVTEMAIEVEYLVYYLLAKLYC